MTRRQKRNARSRNRYRLRKWIRAYGLWCPGAFEFNHKPHYVSIQGRLTIDHIIPLVGEGEFSQDNCRVICEKYNSLKGSKVYEGEVLELAKKTVITRFFSE